MIFCWIWDGVDLNSLTWVFFTCLCACCTYPSLSWQETWWWAVHRQAHILTGHRGGKQPQWGSSLLVIIVKSALPWEERSSYHLLPERAAFSLCSLTPWFSLFSRIKYGYLQLGSIPFLRTLHPPLLLDRSSQDFVLRHEPLLFYIHKGWGRAWVNHLSEVQVLCWLPKKE